MSVDNEWMNFLQSQNNNVSNTNKNSSIKTTVPIPNCLDESSADMIAPECEELYISTKTKVLYLNMPIDIQRIFWLIPITEYWKQTECVIKKQMKIVSKTKDEYEEYCKKLENVPYYTENIIKQIDNPSARRIKFKDERKITIGMSKKDIMNCRGKIKNAFYNCFAMILRFRYNESFKEIHVKVFNTGKLEIPGILNTELLDIVKRMVLEIVQPHIDVKVCFVESDREENVFINSNFNCGFYINRERLYNILRGDKYGIESAYEQCSYPGVKCKFYYNHELGDENDDQQNGQILLEDRKMKMSELIDNNKYSEISFMIFRTGSCLILGNCSNRMLMVVFRFIKNILSKEYPNIYVVNEDINMKIKKTKLRKKTINVTHDFYSSVCSSL
jgi:uncharacterized FlaG/YvyC family protein